MGLVALAGGGWALAISTQAEAGRTSTAERHGATDAEQLRWADTVEAQERIYRQLAATQAGGPEIIAALDRGIEAERELLRHDPPDGPAQHARLERLLAARDDERAKLLAARVSVLEASAAREKREGDAEAALTSLRTALQAQREINASGADKRLKDFVREMALAQAVEKAEAEPLRREVETALRTAEDAEAAQHWADALVSYLRARDVQRTLNQRHGRAPLADFTGIDRIEAKIASLQAADDAAAIDRCEQAGEVAADRGEAQAAAACFREAEDRQRALNRVYPRSRFVSSQRIERLETKRQDALAAGMATAAAGLERAAAEALLKRRIFTAKAKIAEAAALVAELEKSYPKARRFDPELKLELSYLGRLGGELGPLQDRVYERLAPVPEDAGLLMLKTEVSQALYAKIMSSNPSRHTGPRFPVDSVSWDDAQEFCRRLSWVLGARVRLPTAGEYRAAVADGEGAMWSADNAGGRSRETGAQAPNAAGFCDLAGNLAEWLQGGTADDAETLVAGGSYLDAAADLRSLPVVPMARREQARHIGFRFVVELALE